MFGLIRLFDYRCFTKEAPATLQIHEGFTSFVGPNNSGKSALIRAPYELRNALTQLRNLFYGNNLQTMRGPLGWNIAQGLYEHAEIICERSSPHCAIEVDVTDPINSGARYISMARLEFSEDGGNFITKFFDQNRNPIGAPGPQINGISVEYISTADGLIFPAQRLIYFLQLIEAIQYIGPFRNAINEGAGVHFDIQVGTGFIAQWNYWKTGPNRVSNRAIMRVTEDIRRLIGAKTLEIAASSDGKSLQVTLDQRPHKLQELGSGFSQMVLILANALIKKPSIIIIDEPEIHLHPSLQAEFLTTLASYSVHGVIFATHSIGLARQSADRCFTVQRDSHGSVVRPYERTPNLGEFLGSLGIAALQELGWNTILMVEGVKDVRTFQAILRVYEKDRQTIVIPLGGDALANGKTVDELSEVCRLAGINGKVAAIVDSEQNSPEGQPIKARRQFSDNCAALKIPCCVTRRRAIENYVTQRALDEAFAPGKYAAIGFYDQPTNPFWGKGETWRAAKLMTREELDQTDVGRFLAAL